VLLLARCAQLLYWPILAQDDDAYV